MKCMKISKGVILSVGCAQSYRKFKFEIAVNLVRSTSVCTSRGLCSKGNNVKVSQTRQCLYVLAMSIQGFFIGNSREQSFCKVTSLKHIEHVIENNFNQGFVFFFIFLSNSEKVQIHFDYFFITFVFSCSVFLLMNTQLT